MDKNIAGKTMEKWIDELPMIKDIIDTNEVFWINSEIADFKKTDITWAINKEDIENAKERLKRFAPYIAKVFPEARENNGIIESPLKDISNFKSQLQDINGRLLLKCDNYLPISGSIKARGGIYEVLKHAEEIAIGQGLLSEHDDYSKIDSDEFKNLFKKYSIAVGSTGNLGLSIGIISAKLGFKVYVHMSADAKEWKKELLREKGVNVIEYDSDYSKAVEEGRKQAQNDPNMYFIDDENSINLFTGYSVAAERLKDQLEGMNIKVDEEHPLFVYLPCGVGGGPGGVAYGLKMIYRENVHLFFAEPTHSPCMLLGMMTKMHDKVSVFDFGIDNITDADGLAVGRPSGFVGKVMENLLSGVYTVKDDKLYMLLNLLAKKEEIYLEPSALAGIPGMFSLYNTEAGKEYIRENNLEEKMKNSTHIAWATGGGMVPEIQMKSYIKLGENKTF